MPVALGVNGGVLGSNNLPTATTFRGVFTPNEVARAIALGFWPINKSQAVTGVAGSGALGTLTVGTAADPYFEYTTLLLPGNGTNGAQNNTFLDGSTNNFTITRNGNTTQGTFSPFSQTGWGNYFNTNQSIYTSNAAFAVGTGNFTVELFYNPLAWAGTNQRIFVIGQSGTDGVTIQRSSGSNVVEINITASGSTNVISYTWNPTIGQWYHIALVRSGTGTNQTALYIDGVSVATGTSTASIGSTQLSIGGINWVANYGTQGYISNVRYSNIARTITVPTAPYTADANTLLLTCQSNRFVDNSPTPKTFTIQNAPTVVPFSPFNPTSAWSASTVGGSGYFDGTGDYLTAPDNAAFAFGTGDFTIEVWVYWNNVSSTQTLFDFRPNATGSSISPYIELTSSGTLIYYVGGATRITTSAVTATSWTHVALSRSGTSTKIFINGTQSGSTYTDSNSYVQSGATIGLNRNNGGVAFQYMNGYISNFRIVKGTAVYTGAFTPPTAPLTAITNTSLLLNFTNSGIYDATAKNVLETVGDAQASTAITPKWGTTSMKFDPTTGSATDYLQSPDTELLEFGSGNFTIETWVRFNTLPSSGAYYALISKFDNSTQKSYNFYVYNNAGTYQLYFTYTTNGSTNINPVANGITVTTNTWYHYAVSRSGVNLRMFIDGSQVGSTYNIATDTIFGGTYPVQVGASTGANTLNGYLQDLRVTKGYARYTANFTPPTAAFPVQ